MSHWKNEIPKWKIGNCNLSVISRETFKRDWEKLPAIETLIIDEAHAHFGNYKNQAYKALAKYIARWGSPYIFLLTGTPKPSSHWAIYGYGKLLGKQWSWLSWRNKFDFPCRMGMRTIWMPKDNMDEELQTIIRSIGTVIDLKDIADVPDDEEIIETFSLNQTQKSLIKEMFDPLPITRYGRQHQLESAILKTDGYRETISFECDKDKRLLEIVKDNDKIVIVCRYHDQIDKLSSLLLNTGRNIYHIDGRQKKTASEIAPEAENDPTAIVIAQSDTRMGYSLKSFNIMVFVSLPWGWEKYDQMKSRMKAMEKKTPCTYIYMITEGKSVDRSIYESISTGKDFDAELFNNK